MKQHQPKQHIFLMSCSHDNTRSFALTTIFKDNTIITEDPQDKYKKYEK